MLYFFQQSFVDKFKSSLIFKTILSQSQIAVAILLFLIMITSLLFSYPKITLENFFYLNLAESR